MGFSGMDGTIWDYGETSSLVVQVRGLFPPPSFLLFHTKRKTKTIP
jgi:hypothetical protein